MNDTLRNVCSLVGRILLVIIFAISVTNKILHPQGTQQYMAAMGMPMTGFFLIGAIFLELVGTISLLLGYRTKLGALLLIIFMIPTTLIFHMNWSDPAQGQVQFIMFLKNVSMTGGLLMVLAYGPGGYSLDSKK